MKTPPQEQVVRFLSTPAAYGIDGEVVRIDTHISRVFLAGDRAFKLKRAIRLPYVDYSTTERRRAFCEKELRLNRRTAPALYRRVVAVTRAPDGALSIGGTGTPVEWLVEMTRVDQDSLLNVVAQRGAVNVSLAAAIGRAAARLHASATPRYDHGGASQLAWVVTDNDAELSGAGPAIPQDVRARLRDTSLNAVTRNNDLLDLRRVRGWVRECHGDLHLANVCLIDGAPMLFDAIEFNDELSCIDVLYDVAFLVMDLLYRDLPAEANAALNAWLERLPHYDALMLLPLFLSCRAAIRAKVLITAAVNAGPATAAMSQHDAGRYLELALELATPGHGAVVAIGGLSGTGKSTLANRLSSHLGRRPGAFVLRSDVARKRRFGVDPLERLDNAAYGAEVSERIYEELAQAARDVASVGYVAIVDAVFASSRLQSAIRETAEAIRVPFVGLWLDAPIPLMEARLRARRDDASDATVDVLHQQQATASVPADWHQLDASREIDAVAAAALALCAARASVGATPSTS